MNLRKLAYEFMAEILSDSQRLTIDDPRILKLRFDSINLDEFLGFYDCIMERCLAPTVSFSTLDTCGTGGDGKSSFNVSSAAALCAAALGIIVGKSGNRSSSGITGSADFMETLGFELNASGDKIKENLLNRGFAFLFTPNFHPSIAPLSKLRKELKRPTVFNLLGPLCSPLNPTHRVIGLPSPNLFGVYADALQEIGVSRTILLSSDDGYDEVSVGAPTSALEVNTSGRKFHRLFPAKLGIVPHETWKLKVRNSKHSVQRFKEAIANKDRPIRDFCTVNTAAALWAANKVGTFEEGVLVVKNSYRGRVIENYLTRYIFNTSQNNTRSAHPRSPLCI